jgi:K+-transporting ATPase KdpA subunit
MGWKEYSIAMLLFSAVTMLLTYALQRLQTHLPWNPQHLGAVAPDLAFNTAASFTANTNWQSYTPESTMSYLTQMAGLATHNFWSAAVGIALAVALIRGIARKETNTLGNFWVDLTRATLRILVPISIVFGLVLVSQGVVQNLRPYDTAKLVQPQTITTTGTDGKPTTQTITTQTIAQGPVASQEVIKMLGTNGGGFFNANSAHPFENPTPFSNFLEMLLILAIPAGFTATLGRITKSPKHGWAVFATMAVLFFAGTSVAYWAESQPNPLLHGVAQHVTAAQSGGNMEGKEVRFGITNSALFASVTTDASCGAVNGMHDSFMPLGGMVPLVNIMLGEVVFGGVGAGMYGVLIMVVLTVFIAGLMVGRTPEYLGKKIEASDTGRVHDRPSDGAPRASELFSEHILQHCLIQAQIGDQLLQPAVLLLELFHLTRLIRLHTNVLLLPSVKGLLADPDLADHLRHWHSQLRLLHHSHDLLHGKPLLLHAKSPFRFCRRLTFQLAQKYRGPSPRDSSATLTIQLVQNIGKAMSSSLLFMESPSESKWKDPW